jgi:peptidyl-prolyl cis-trans isomerase D
LTRAQVQALGQNSEKFAQAVFSPDSLQAKRNTEAIEVAPNALMAAHVIEYKAAMARPFADVSAAIRAQLERRAASELAQKAAQEKLALLQQGKDASLVFGKAVSVTRNQPQPGFPADALTKIFQADAAKLPTYVGSSSEQGGYTIYKIEQVIAPPPPEASRVTAFVGRLGDQVGRELFLANIASLKAKAEVKVNQTNLEKK